MNNQNDSKILKENRETMPLTKKNFIAMAVSVGLIIVGFLLMLGGSSTVEEFNPDIFSTRRIVVGPFLAALLPWPSPSYGVLMLKNN